MFENNTDDQTDIQEEIDYIGGSRTLDTDVYDFVIDMAYYDTSSGGAGSLNLTLKTKTGVECKQTLWVKSGNAKGNKNFYVDKNQQKRFLPGFIAADAIALLAAKKGIMKMPTATKTVMIYDYDAKKELPQQREVLMELLGQEITLGMVKQIVDKNVDDGNGNYIATGLTRTENEIDKVFRTRDGMTVPEVRAQAAVATFKDKWIQKNQGTVQDRTIGQIGEVATLDANGKPAGANVSAADSSADADESLFD